MGAERLFLGYASTVAQAANTSTGARIVSGQGNYAAQKQADRNGPPSLHPATNKRKKQLVDPLTPLSKNTSKR
jgi:hypothetical protein